MPSVQARASVAGVGVDVRRREVGCVGGRGVQRVGGADQVDRVAAGGRVGDSAAEQGSLSDEDHAAASSRAAVRCAQTSPSVRFRTRQSRRPVNRCA